MRTENKCCLQINDWVKGGEIWDINNPICLCLTSEKCTVVVNYSLFKFLYISIEAL